MINNIKKRSFISFIKVYAKIYLRWVKNQRIKKGMPIPEKEHNKAKDREFKIQVYLIKKKFKRYLKLIFSFNAKLIGWTILFGIICFAASYNIDDENSIPFWVVLVFYIGLIINHIGLKQLYKDWEQQAEYDEFYKRFCKQYKPKIFDDLICFWIGLKFFNTSLFICLIFFLCIYDTWNRRYITNDIKHDMILEKFKNKE